MNTNITEEAVRERARAHAALDKRGAEIADWVRCADVTDPEASDAIRALCHRLAATKLALEALTVAHAARLDLLEEVLADVRREAKGFARREGR